jgi:hypothetical protein
VISRDCNLTISDEHWQNLNEKRQRFPEPSALNTVCGTNEVQLFKEDLYIYIPVDKYMK